MSKVLGHINLEPYFEWYANWLGITVEEIKSDKREISPFNMLSEWLEQFEKPCSDFIEKEVYFSINREHKDEITYDSWLEGVCVKKGLVENITATNITISGTTYKLPFYNNGLLYEKLEHCLLHIIYDGYDGIIDIGLNGAISINKQYSDELVVIECE